MTSSIFTPKPAIRKELVMVRLTEEEHKQLKALSQKTNLPMATLAYQAVRYLLDEQFGKDGAQ